jgi:hypothetical protein
MKISFEIKEEFDDVLSWLKRVSSSNPTNALNQIASEGTRSLASHTPRETGETASGWNAKVTTKGNITEIDWTNNAHPESEANVAKLIELGHGTRTGGYVPPRPYIKQAMEPIFNKVGDKVVKELIK